MFDVFYIGRKPNLFPHEQEADSIEYACQQSRTRYCWIVNYLSDYSSWDWIWEPPPWQSHQRHAWRSQWQKDSGTYLVPKNGYTDTNYHNDQVITRLPDHNMWQTPMLADTNSFDFSWHPDPTDPPYIYEFGTQHQRTGGPRYIVPNATDTKYVDQIKIKTHGNATTVYIVNHMDGNINVARDQLHSKLSNIKSVRYFDNYLDLLKLIAKNADNDHHEFIWITSSICDYTDFDWTWHPEQWQASMLHVFASDYEKFGDTFFMHVPTFVARSETCKLLEWYDLNFVSDISVPRRPLPVIVHDNDTHVDAIKTTEWAGPLAVFSTQQSQFDKVPCVPLWREKTKTIVPLSKGASSVIVPRTAIPFIKTQGYDYPHIEKTHRNSAELPLDIVFLSNGEAMAESNWQHLLDSVPPGRNVHRIDKVNGRVRSEQAAAQVSSTNFYFRVPAKLRVAESFDWNWQPDRLQQSKNYIFHAHNPVNGLEYGHMAIVAYSRRLVFATAGNELDFSMESLHEVVPVLSGQALYADDAVTAWRTAFRECIKLKHSLPDVENQYRLEQWLNNNFIGEAGNWSIRGAHDAIDYYDSINGEFDKLKLTYDWEWLINYAESTLKLKFV